MARQNHFKAIIFFLALVVSKSGYSEDSQNLQKSSLANDRYFFDVSFENSLKAHWIKDSSVDRELFLVSNIVPDFALSIVRVLDADSELIATGTIGATFYTPASDFTLSPKRAPKVSYLLAYQRQLLGKMQGSLGLGLRQSPTVHSLRRLSAGVQNQTQLFFGSSVQLPLFSLFSRTVSSGVFGNFYLPGMAQSLAPLWGFQIRFFMEIDHLFGSQSAYQLRGFFDYENLAIQRGSQKSMALGSSLGVRF